MHKIGNICLLGRRNRLIWIHCDLLPKRWRPLVREERKKNMAACTEKDGWEAARLPAKQGRTVCGRQLIRLYARLANFDFKNSCTWYSKRGLEKLCNEQEVSGKRVIRSHFWPIEWKHEKLKRTSPTSADRLFLGVMEDCLMVTSKDLLLNKNKDRVTDCNGICA